MIEDVRAFIVKQFDDIPTGEIETLKIDMDEIEVYVDHNDLKQYRNGNIPLSMVACSYTYKNVGVWLHSGFTDAELPFFDLVAQSIGRYGFDNEN